MPNLSAENQQLVSQLKEQGYDNIFERDGQIYVASSTADGTKVSNMMLGSQALAGGGTPLNVPEATGGQSGKGKRARYKRDMGQIINEDELLRQRRIDAANTPWLESAMIYAGREADKLGAGLADIADIGRGMFGEDITTNMERRNKRMLEQREKDELFKPFAMESPTGSGIGSMLPYMVTGAAEPLATKTAGKILDTVGSGVRKGATAVGRGAATGGRTIGQRIAEQYRKIEPSVPTPIDTAIKSGIRKTEGKFAREIGEPIARTRRRWKSREPLEDKFAGSPVREALGATALGAAESGVHYDDTVTEGGISSLLGHATGKKFKNTLSQAPNLNSAADNAVLAKWSEIYGYRPLPGMETGIPEIQKMASDARTDVKYASGVRQIDNANMDAIARVAADASGIEGKVLRNMSPEELDAHVKGLRQRYEDLEAQTSGVPDSAALDAVIDKLDEYPTATQNKLMNIMAKIENGFSGKDYKKIRKELKDAHTNARMGNRDEQEAYKMLINELDDSIQRGMTTDLGQQRLQDWRDLNEQYAMTKFMLENGLDSTGRIDKNKLTQKLMSTDAERLLTGRGGRIGKFHDIARLSRIEQSQAGGGLGSVSVDPLDDSKPLGIFMTPAAGEMGTFRRMKFTPQFRWQYPSKTGYLGLPRKGLLSAERLGAAHQQGTDAYVEAPEKIQNYYDKLYNQALGLLNPQD